MSKRMPNGYWQRWDNVERELKGVIRKLGHFPTSSELENIGRGDIVNAAYRHWETLGRVRKRMGYDPIRKPRDYWARWENVSDELKTVVSNLGYFPTQIELQKMGLDSLNGAMNRHGGINRAKRRIEREMKKKLDIDKSWYLRDLERKFGLNLKEYLQRQYVEKRLPAYKIAKELKVGKSSILRWLDMYCIKIRSISEARIDPVKLPSKEELEKSLDEGKTHREIAETYNVSRASIERLIREYGITLDDSQQLESLLEDYASGGENEQ